MKKQNNTSVSKEYFEPRNAVDYKVLLQESLTMLERSHNRVMYRVEDRVTTKQIDDLKRRANV